MKTVKINEIELPAIGMGTWHMGEREAKSKEEEQALLSFLENGKRMLDTAEMYGEGRSESLIGKALEKIPRDNVYLVSKVYPWNASQRKLPQSLDASLKRLGTDYLDLYLLHWRGNIPLAETVEALEQAKKSGKIRAWGVSNFDKADMEELFALPNGKNCAVNQVLYNLGTRGIEYDLLPWMRENNLPLVAYSPIAQGDSLGDNFLENPELQEIAKTHNASIFQILLAWTIRLPQVFAIPQSGNKNHILENLQAEKIDLSSEELALIDQIYPAPNKETPLAML